jgi:hypothetical protein
MAIPAGSRLDNRTVAGRSCMIDDGIVGDEEFGPGGDGEGG